VVGAAAAALAALIVDPMPATPVAAVANISGVAITNDIPHLPTIRLSPIWSPRTIKTTEACRELGSKFHRFNRNSGSAVVGPDLGTIELHRKRRSPVYALALTFCVYTVLRAAELAGLRIWRGCKLGI
jgi:integrase